MRRHLTLLLAAMILSTPAIVMAQSKNSDQRTPVARISYHYSYAWDAAESGYPHICFALYDGGYYQVSRLTMDGPQTLQGKLSRSQFSRLRELIKGFDFDSAGGWVVRKGAESLLIDVTSDDTTVRHRWVNPDRERPLPDAAVKIIGWLQNFEDKGATPLTLRELGESICPPGSLKPLQPTVADLRPTFGNGFCEDQQPQ